MNHDGDLCDARHRTRKLATCRRGKQHDGYHDWHPKIRVCGHPKVSSSRRLPECLACGAYVARKDEA